MPETLTFTDADQGTSRPAALGQSVTVRLKENPTTGYLWKFQADPGSAIEVLDSDYLSSGNLPGAGGTREFHLRTKKAGSVQLHLTLLRSWEGEGSAVERRDFTLEVSPGASD